MGVLSMDGSSSSSSSSNFACQKCGCACAKEGAVVGSTNQLTKSSNESPFSLYARENDAFFDQIEKKPFPVPDSSSHTYQLQSQHQQQLIHKQKQHSLLISSTLTPSSTFHDFHQATTSANLDLQHQVESLKARLKQSSEHVEKLEHSLFESRQRYEQDAKKYQSECRSSREKYERLLESHKQMQRVNQMLEEKVISSAEKAEKDGAKLKATLVALTTQLSSSTARVNSLETLNERLRRDCSIAVRLLQCRSSSFLTHRFDDLPADLRDRVKANLTYEEIKRMEEERKSNNGIVSAGVTGLWSFFALPAVPSVISTFPPSAAFFEERPKCDVSDAANEKNGADFVMIDMGEGVNDRAGVDLRAQLPTSVLARVFDPAAHLSVTPSSPNTPDLYPCSSSSSSSSDESNVQHYKCSRCRLRCATSVKWTQTPLAPIYGGDGTPTRPTDIAEEVTPPTLPVHLLGWGNADSTNAFSTAIGPLPPPPPPSTTVSLRDPNFSAYPDLVTSAEMTAHSSRSRLASDSSFVSSSASSIASSRTVQSQTEASLTGNGPQLDADQTAGGLCYVNSAPLFTPFASVNAPACIFDPFEPERRRNNSEAGSTYGSGWGEIHLLDASAIVGGGNGSLAQSDVILDISLNEEWNGGGGGVRGDSVDGSTSTSAAMNHVTSGRPSGMEEIALPDDA